MSKTQANAKEKSINNSNTNLTSDDTAKGISIDSYLEGLTPENISTDSIFSFRNHPYKVEEDDAMDILTESIRNHGIITPVIVRPMGDKYELISGHRRLHAAEMLRLQTIPAYVKDFSDIEATTIMAHSNIQREKVKPSEQAKAFAMQYEAMKHQGRSGGGSTLEQIGHDNGISSKQVQNYISLNKLRQELLDKLDAGKLTFTKALELSKLPQEEQMKHMNASTDSNPINRRSVTLRETDLSEFFDDSFDSKAIKNKILTILKGWKICPTAYCPKEEPNINVSIEGGN